MHHLRTVETKRYRRIKVAVNDVEAQEMQARAERRGMSLAAFLRWCGLHCGDAAATA